jgi:prolyl-tRNA editing enzyme YbaK/EbsC (Cys-tRNA(Pro) deacylase)
MNYKQPMQEPAGSAARVAEELRRLGVGVEIREMPDSTRSAPEAAAAIGCHVAQIVKSLVFRAVERDDPVLVLASGSVRVDEAKLAAAVGEPVEQASGKYVRERTGFAIGGVAPIGHAQPLSVYMDETLLDHDELWAAAGTPRSVFRTTPQELQQMTKAKVADLAEATPS